MVFINVIVLLPPLLFLVIFLKMQPLASSLHIKYGLGFSNEPAHMGPASDVSSNSPVTTASSSE